MSSIIAKTKIMTNRIDSKANWNNYACLMSLTYRQLQPTGDVKGKLYTKWKRDVSENISILVV